jgi:hypothetical protein
MTRLIATLAIAAVTSSGALAQPPSQMAPACTSDALDVSGGAWAERTLSVGTFRLALDRDTSRGPTTAVTLETGTIKQQSNPKNQPYLLVEVGDDKRSCSLRTSFTQCPAAGEVVARPQG